MLTDGVIRTTQSEFASPLLVVPKTDGKWRCCVDYRLLNALTVKDTYPLPLMDYCSDSLGTAQYFTTLDANSGYWKVQVYPEDRHKTAFVSHSGEYEFTRMPFRLCNSPATFQITMDLILSQYTWQSCLVYLDDVIVLSKNLTDHIGHVERILGANPSAGFSLKLSKCSFFVKSVDYLGHKVMPGKLAVAQRTIDAVQGFRNPSTQTCIRSFLELCNVYRRFVPNFARKAAPLNKLLKKDHPAMLEPLTEEEYQAFHKLEDALSSLPILELPQLGLPVSINTDASNHQVGCVLL